jgi:hypothetical protein
MHRRTVIKELSVAFRNFANAPNKDVQTQYGNFLGSNKNTITIFGPLKSVKYTTCCVSDCTVLVYGYT